MTSLIQEFEKKQMAKKVPDVRPGDTVRVHQKIIEGGKQRIQAFEGVVIKVKGEGIRRNFTVRKIASGVGVEKTFPFYAPNVSKIEIIKRAKVRRAVLNYLRNLKGKKARLKAKEFDVLAVNIKEEAIEAEKEEKIDEEITELKPEAIQDMEPDVSTDDIAKQENKDVKEDHGIAEDESLTSAEEVQEGLEKAEKEDSSEQQV